MAESYTATPLSALRKVIAARMTEATRTIPHFRLVSDLSMDALLALRAQANANNPTSKLSINDCLIKACAAALAQHPALNIQLVGDDVHTYHDADISVVIAVEGGLATPVIRGANRKSLWEIAAEVKHLTDRAMRKQLRMEEILGGSFTISNLGAYGVDEFDAIINPPQCAILALGRVGPRMVVSEEGSASIASVLRATLSVDHRVIDGTTGALFLATLRQTVEQPSALFAAGPR